MSAKRIVILISGTGSNMVNLVEACQAGEISGDVVCVISNRADAGGLAKAQELGVATEVIPHQSYSDRESYDLALAECIEHYQPDVIVLAGFMRILSSQFVTRFAGKMLNIHPSLLPKYKGLHTHRRALENGDTRHGVSVHFVSEELDGGPVILQAEIPIFENDTEEDLQARVHEQEYRIYPWVLKWICADRLRLTPAGAELDGELLGPQGYASE